MVLGAIIFERIGIEPIKKKTTFAKKIRHVKNIFEKAVTEELIERLNKITPETKPLWGKMDAAQMAAHCCVTYEMVYDNKHPQPNGFTKMLLKMLVKNMVVNEKPYKKNGHTAKEFIMNSEKNLDVERTRLIQYLQMSLENGTVFFEGKESHSFGKLTAKEWNNMFYKHLDHHLTQFGV